MDPEERRALTALCAELIELRKECAQLPDDKQQLLSRIEVEARARRPVLPLLRELLGTSRSDPLQTLGGGLPGAGPGRADEERFGCPDRACDRTATTYPAGPVPRCRLSGESMKRT
ncbi:hypothetical protein ACFWBN_22085 [Streptomyces sp. NPDC059989]|uniref:hypothetical protein n=1 Tax=Streptomyces sp. NPDC059989 TaxID=3347026 RepID=UPI0036C9745B